MKIVVFSDAHGRQKLVETVLDFNPDADIVISLGDSELQNDFFIKRSILNVKGNYIGDAGLVYDRDIMVEDKKILITHGHRYKVHRGLYGLLEKALDDGYDIVLYGHTHVLRVNETDGVTFINPGSLSNPRSKYPESYVIMYLEPNRFDIVYKNARTNETLEVTE